MSSIPIENSQKRVFAPKQAPDYDSARTEMLALDELREVFRYRELIFQLVRRDVVARYKRSVMGIAWTMLNPLGMMIVLSLVFSQIFKTVPGFPAYVLSGIIIWNFFAQTTTSIINVFVWGSDFFQRIYLPRSTFAFAAIGTGLVNLLLSLVPLIIVMLVIRTPITPAIIFQPIPILLFACFALGSGLLVASLAVYFPDVAEMYQIVLTAWSYLSAIFYPIEILPEEVRSLMWLNPIMPLIQLFRMPIYEGKIPALPDILPATIISLLALVIGWWVFTKKSDEFAYRT
jgi:ABC-2 type transport system permease protein